MVKVKYNDEDILTKVLVGYGNHKNILGRNWIDALHLSQYPLNKFCTTINSCGIKSEIERLEGMLDHYNVILNDLKKQLNHQPTYPQRSFKTSTDNTNQPANTAELFTNHPKDNVQNRKCRRDDRIILTTKTKTIKTDVNKSTSSDSIPVQVSQPLRRSSRERKPVNRF